jgi:hypothetical protein
MMKRGLILTIMLACTLALGFSQTALSGLFSNSAYFSITFSGNTFTGNYGTDTMSGTYSDRAAGWSDRFVIYPTNQLEYYFSQMSPLQISMA